jgi:GNAT superfamily N-acetyltransferase
VTIRGYGLLTVPATFRRATPADEEDSRLLFVAQDHWGSGLAVTLHAASVEEARRRGFAEMRLFTPADHGRARRFYEREGWAQRAEPFDEPRLGMALVEYRYALA